MKDLKALAAKVQELTDEEKRLIAVLRDLEYGHVKIFVRGGEPVRIEEGVRSIMLADE